MGSLVFTCPKTGQDIVSGIETNAESLSGIRHTSVNVFCPICGTVHYFPAKDGRVSGIPTAD
jgi:hypothetical protein